MQVDVRLLPTASYGAALQYFTGSEGAQCLCAAAAGRSMMG